MPPAEPIDAIAREAAKIFLTTKSVLFNSREPFVFTSGRISPVYVDTRRLISFPQERTFLMNAGTNLLREKVGLDNIDYLAGGETAGIPFCGVSLRPHEQADALHPQKAEGLWPHGADRRLHG